MSEKKSEFAQTFLQTVGRPLKENVDLRGFSNFKIGGPADFFFEAETAAELKAAVRAARDVEVPFTIIGGGFNILFDDAGFRGLILKNSAKGLALADPGLRVKAASGTSTGELVDYALANGLEGLEFLAGIPGTVGGAVFGNAGAFGQCLGDFLEEALLLTRRGGEMRVSKDHFQFGYRHSKLKLVHDILMEATFRLRPGDRGKIRTKIAENLAVRAKKHPPQDTAYAGSFFKNPPLIDGAKTAAGYLLEQVGARDLKVGGAVVYPGHCNLLINADRATARDVLALAAELKERVRARFGIVLEEEVIFLPSTVSGF
ncbi:MAG: UDP-N-acetylmuramate dehydrogenase [Candidatus Aminicenantes bacterium]|nr:UDP-N-acetylmuramate dehydrogenase [Candidatus Aminicenantes bacterium]